MEQKTKVNAEEGRQELFITREFDLPVELVFRAHTEADLIEQWMGTKVLKLESRKHGGYQLRTGDDKGNVYFQANGAIHEFVPNKKIIRTFEMDNAPFGVQLEIYEFTPLTDDTSLLKMHVIYESVALRDQVLTLPFKQGINMAHDKMQAVASKLK
ncbi:MAG TPA: SRPBCC domain-containing protein [Puia sp.]|jgi:uncharacterized protein YndB with AHSA1/START domain